MALMFTERLPLEDMDYRRTNTAKGINEIFYDNYRDNLIVYAPHVNSCAEQLIAFTQHNARAHLLNKLKKKKNLTVYWFQPYEFGTGEYIVFKDFDNNVLKRRTHSEVVKLLHRSIKQVDDSFESRYRYVENGVLKSYVIKNTLGELIV